MPPETSWTLEFGRSFKKLRALYRFLNWEFSPLLEEVSDTYPIFVPRRLAEKIKLQGKDGVLAREFLPNEFELDQTLNAKGLLDPIGDRVHHVAPQLIHRYPSRALFTATSICPVHCRYCFRKNELNPSEEFFQSEFPETLKYLNNHPEISEIIFTGGDPFTLSNERLTDYLDAFSKIPSLKDVRFHTRYPVILPERIDGDLLHLLERATKLFRTVSVAIHANHVSEFDHASEKAVLSFQKSGVQTLSQTVLLSGVNDSTQALVDLINQLLKLLVRPYYLHHPDRVRGGMHFYVPLQKGRAIYAPLRKQLPGWALPHYVLDVPGGRGKINAMGPGRPIDIQEPDLFV